MSGTPAASLSPHIAVGFLYMKTHHQFGSCRLYLDYRQQFKGHLNSATDRHILAPRRWVRCSKDTGLEMIGVEGVGRQVRAKPLTQAERRVRAI